MVEARPPPLVRNLPCSIFEGDARTHCAQHGRWMAKTSQRPLRGRRGGRHQAQKFADGSQYERESNINLMWTLSQQRVAPICTLPMRRDKIPDVLRIRPSDIVVA